MKIKLQGRNSIFTSRNKEGQLCSVNLSDFSGKINFRRIVRSCLKDEGVLVITRAVETGSPRFFASMKRPLTAIVVLKIALKVDERLRLDKVNQ